MTTTTNRLEQLITLLEEARDDHDKFFECWKQRCWNPGSQGDARGKGSRSGTSS